MDQTAPTLTARDPTGPRLRRLGATFIAVELTLGLALRATWPARDPHRYRPPPTLQLSHWERAEIEEAQRKAEAQLRLPVTRAADAAREAVWLRVLDGRSRAAIEDFRRRYDAASGQRIAETPLYRRVGVEHLERDLAAFEALVGLFERNGEAVPPRTRFERGTLRLAVGELDGARQDFIAVYARCDYHYDADWFDAVSRLEWAFVALQLGDTMEATSIARQASRVDETDANGQAYNGRCSWWAGEGGSFDDALYFDPRSSLAYYSRALMVQEHGIASAARVDLDRAVAANPRNVDARFHRAVARLDAADLTGMVADADQILEVDSSHTGARVFRAIARLAGGDRAGAIAECAAIDGRRWRFATLISGVQPQEIPWDPALRLLRNLCEPGAPPPPGGLAQLLRAMEASPIRRVPLRR